MDELEKMETTSYFNCLQAALCFFCDKYNVNPIYLFLNSYGIEYGIKQADAIGGRIRPYIPIGFERCFEEIYGFTFNQISIEAGHIERALKMNENGILVEVDAFFCPWNEAFRTSHIAHFCIVKSVDIVNKILICADPYLKREEVTWSISLFSKGPFAAFDFKIQPKKKEVSLADVNKVLFSYLSKSDILLNYKRIMDDLLNVNCKNDLFENANPNSCKLIICSKQIANNYKGHALMFYHILSKSGKLEERKSGLLIETLQRAGDMWAGLNLVFIRMVLKKGFDMDKMSWIMETLDEIKSLDICIVDLINNIGYKEID